VRVHLQAFRQADEISLVFEDHKPLTFSVEAFDSFIAAMANLKTAKDGFVGAYAFDLEDEDAEI